MLALNRAHDFYDGQDMGTDKWRLPSHEGFRGF
jgi:hypothetical protein